MAPEDAESCSALARERDNNLYKEGNLGEAEKAYREAAELAPDDPSPLSNLSAVLFEKGNYDGSLGFIKRTIALSESEAQDRPTKQRLLSRAVKCCIHALNFQGAADALEALEASGSGELAGLRDALSQAQSLWASAPDVKAHRGLVLDRLPRYTPDLLDEPEYYPNGHDQPEFLIDMSSPNDPPKEKDLSIMFCGSGDARHVFTNLISFWLMGTLSHARPKIHMTLLDIKPAALARTVVMFDMAQTFALMKFMKTQGYEDALVNMSYLYACPYIPPFAMEKFKKQLPPLIKTLEEGGSLFSFFYSPPDTRSRILAVLKQWNTPLPLQFRSRSTRAGARRRSATMQNPAWDGIFSADKKTHRDFMAIFASDSYISRREPALSPLLESYRKDEPGAKDRLEEYIAANWVPNPMLIDFAWEDTYAATYHLDPDFPREDSEEAKADWTAKVVPSAWAYCDPTETAQALSRGVPAKQSEYEGAIDAMCTVFSSLALSFIELGSRIIIEMIAGEMCDVMERMRHGVLEHRHLSPSAGKEPDPRTFPSSYDRIHMSNIPDYAGGLLPVVLHGRPLLREDRQSNLRYNIMLNPPMFESHAHFQAEYLLMPDTQQITDSFALERRPPRDPEGVRTGVAAGIPRFIVEDYVVWNRTAAPSNSWPPPLARGALERFMHAHLLKIALPHPRPAESNMPICAPLNATVLLRLAEHMGSRQGAGCPPHWVSEVLAAWCSGTVSTTARAPRELVVEPESVRLVHARRDMCVAPWRAELTTLVGIWRRLLPFGIIAADASADGRGTPASLDKVRHYSIKISQLGPPIAQRAGQFILVLWEAAGNGAVAPPAALRRLLLDDEQGGDTSTSARRIREGGVHIVTTLELVYKTATARFWLRSDVVEEMRGGDWRAYVWRTDTWERASDGTNLADIVDEGGWLDVKSD